MSAIQQALAGGSSGNNYHYSYVGVASNNIDATSITISKPTGVVDGDLMVANIGGAGNGGPTWGTLPSGWTQALSYQRIWVMWKFASSEPSSYTFPITDGVNKALVGSIVAFRSTRGSAGSFVSTDGQIMFGTTFTYGGSPVSNTAGAVVIFCTTSYMYNGATAPTMSSQTINSIAATEVFDGSNVFTDGVNFWIGASQSYRIDVGVGPLAICAGQSNIATDNCGQNLLFNP